MTYRELREQLFKEPDQKRIVNVKTGKLAKWKKMTVEELRHYCIEHYNIDSEVKIKIS